MFGMGIGEVIVIGIIAVLLFGKRLPEVARTLGGHYQEFRRGLNEIQTEMSRASREVDRSVRDTTSKLLTYDEDDYAEPTALQFQVPPPGEVSHQPTEESNR